VSGRRPLTCWDCA